MSKGRMNKSQRMQLKALICVLGLLFLLLLFLARIIMLFLHGEPEQEHHVPVTEMLSNVWIMEADGASLLVFQDGEEKEYPCRLTAGDTAPQAQGQTGDAFAPGQGQTGDVLSEQEQTGDVPSPEQLREQVADLVVTDGVVTEVQVKNEKINARVLSADDAGVELEGYGKIPFAEDYKGYRIYKSLSMCTYKDLLFGYDFADFVMEEGKICGLLLVKEEAMEYIRVLVKASDFSGLFHEQLEITSDTDFTVSYGAYDNRQTEAYQTGETVLITKDSPYFEGERVLIAPAVLTGKITLHNVSRSQGMPSYRGQIELQCTEEGIVVVNQVLLEEYLYCVVPSEMPASYPDQALQAQAVCARTYAYGHMHRAGYPQYGAHVDDSTSYQVYNNILEQESTTTAVKETFGQILFTPEGKPAETYYYSTSCGVGTDATIWKTEEAKTLDYIKGKAINRQTMDAVLQGSAETVSDMGALLQEESAFAPFILQTQEGDFEAAEAWYRWTYEVSQIDLERMLGLLKKRYEANSRLVLTLQDGEYVSKPIEELDWIRNLYIAARESGGIADELVIETGKNTYKVVTEHNIRYVLNNGDNPVIRQDGSEVDVSTLLPSAFVTLHIEKEGEAVIGYSLSGGGFGHGVGMSQNGAGNMAQSGYTAGQILAFFYEGCTIENVYGQ